MDRDSFVGNDNIRLQLEAFCGHKVSVFVDMEVAIPSVSRCSVWHLNLEKTVSVNRHVGQGIGCL